VHSGKKNVEIRRRAVTEKKLRRSAKKGFTGRSEQGYGRVRQSQRRDVEGGRDREAESTAV